jgi:hypothetical protein
MAPGIDLADRHRARSDAVDTVTRFSRRVNQFTRLILPAFPDLREEPDLFPGQYVPFVLLAQSALDTVDAGYRFASFRHHHPPATSYAPRSLKDSRPQDVPEMHGYNNSLKL